MSGWTPMPAHGRSHARPLPYELPGALQPTPTVVAAWTAAHGPGKVWWVPADIAGGFAGGVRRQGMLAREEGSRIYLWWPPEDGTFEWMMREPEMAVRL